MFGYKQLKPVPAPIFMAQLIKFGKWLATPPPGQASDDSDWYAGLCVDPRGFTDQLGKLQTSLRSTGDAVSAKPHAQVNHIHG